MTPSNSTPHLVQLWAQRIIGALVSVAVALFVGVRMGDVTREALGPLMSHETALKWQWCVTIVCAAPGVAVLLSVGLYGSAMAYRQSSHAYAYRDELADQPALTTIVTLSTWVFLRALVASILVGPTIISAYLLQTDLLILIQWLSWTVFIVSGPIHLANWLETEQLHPMLNPCLLAQKLPIVLPQQWIIAASIGGLTTYELRDGVLTSSVQVFSLMSLFLTGLALGSSLEGRRLRRV